MKRSILNTITLSFIIVMTVCKTNDKNSQEKLDNAQASLANFSCYATGVKLLVIFIKIFGWRHKFITFFGAVEIFRN